MTFERDPAGDAEDIVVRDTSGHSLGRLSRGSCGVLARLLEVDKKLEGYVDRVKVDGEELTLDVKVCLLEETWVGAAARRLERRVAPRD